MKCGMPFLWPIGATALLCAAGASGASKHGLTLARDGKPTATLVLSQEPTRAAQLAAFELQWHVKEISGATLPIIRGDEKAEGVRVLVGESAASRALGLKGDDFKAQEYLVRFMPNTLVLMGKDKVEDAPGRADASAVDYAAYATWPGLWEEQGTLYAAYEFLEKFCGVRWLNPTDTGTLLPKKPTLTVKGSEVRRAPFFHFRGGTFVDRNLETYDAHIGLWPAGSEGLKDYEAAAYAELRKQFPNPGQYLHAKRARIRLFLHRMRAGGEKANCNHSLYGYYDRFWKKNPKNPDAFEAEHPDWFAQGYEGQPPQMCYTSPGLIKQVAQDARDYFDKGGDPKRGFIWGENFFAVEPMDNSSFCKCATCQPLLGKDEPRAAYSVGRASDYFFNFVNEVAKEVKKTHPHKRVSTLAYMTHAWPPKKITLDPYVAVQFCFVSNRAPWWPKEYQNDLNALDAWAQEARHSGRPLYLWLYYTFPVEVANNGKFHCFPGFFAHTIAEQFKLFHKIGIRGMFHCGYGQEVEAYVTFKLMDDPTLDVDDLLDGYFTGLYGSAAKPMRKLYEEIERAYCNPKSYPEDIASGKRSSHQNVKLAWEHLGTAERMEKLGKLLDKAKSEAKTDTEKQNVGLFEKAVWNYMTAGRNTYAKRMSAPIPSVKAPRVPAANGDVVKVDWSKAAPLGGTWFDRGQDKPAPRPLAGRIAHDGEFLYLELT
ncbi:MAG: DUF4838 domain-containing protein, partial [Planctomycetes bacterium]|nr:DUF4838 domain-containing protein [Planctomycetota bacterium]